MSDYKEQCWKRYMENMKYERYEKEDLVDEIIEMQGEIERLNNKIQDLQADYGNIAQVERDFLKEENKRLNNIIESFEEELEREVNIKEENTSLNHNTYIDVNSTLKAVLKRFRELKGSDKE